MALPLFYRIVTAVTNYDPFFHNNTDCTRKEGISPLIKCTSAIRQLAYGMNGNFLDEYMQISERSSRMDLDHFCEAVMKIYGPEFLRKPTVTDIEKFYRHHEEKHGFPGIRDHGSNPFILLEVVASQDLWMWHAFFCVAGSNNDINVLYQSPLFNDLKTDRAPEIPFVANSVSYPSRYYLVDRIYSELTPLVKKISKPEDDDHKRILYKQKQESTRKYVERAFGVLKKKLAILANSTQAQKKNSHQPEDLLGNEEQMERVMSDPDAIVETVFTESVGLNEMQSTDPFNIYDLLNKGKQQENTKVSYDSISREHLPGFTPKEDDKELDHVDDNISEPKEDLQEDKDVNSTCSKLKSNSLNSGCSCHFKVSNVPKSGGSILNYMEELVKVGQTMGYKMEGCENDIMKIIEAQGDDSVHR
nr:hypothetical protein [Tanacetum cinerariifolium]